jgi:hypothetical protein
VFSYPTAVTLSGATVAPASGKSGKVNGNPTVSADEKRVTVNLTDISDVQTITLTLLGVNDGANSDDVAVRMGILVGDSTNNRVLNSSDISQIKLQSGMTATSLNFRADVNASASINGSDIGLAKLNLGWHI